MAALAEQRADPSGKLKALHELGRLIWLEERLGRAIDVTPNPVQLEYQEHLKRMEENRVKRLEEARALRQAALAPSPPESPQLEEDFWTLAISTSRASALVAAVAWRECAHNPLTSALTQISEAYFTKILW